MSALSLDFHIAEVLKLRTEGCRTQLHATIAKPTEAFQQHSCRLQAAVHHCSRTQLPSPQQTGVLQADRRESSVLQDGLRGH